MESEFEVMRKRIRELRETAGLSQNRLGKLAGIQQASINRYEHGQAVPSPKALLWYAEYFDVSLDYLFGRTDSPHGIRYPYKRDHKPVDEKTQKVVDLCFDENSPIREKLKETLVGILGDAMWEENEHE